MASDSKAESEDIFINTREAIDLWTKLLEMGHPQPATPMQVENFTCDGITNRKPQQKLSKAMDMRFYWAIDILNKKTLACFGNM